LGGGKGKVVWGRERERWRSKKKKDGLWEGEVDCAKGL